MFKTLSITLVAIVAMLSIGTSVFAHSTNPAAPDSPAHIACEGASASNVYKNGECVSSSDGTTLFGKGGIFERVANVLLLITGAVSVIMIIVGGFRYVVSGGSESGVKGAKNQILYAVIGLVVTLLAFAIVNFVISAAS